MGNSIEKIFRERKISQNNDNFVNTKAGIANKSIISLILNQMAKEKIEPGNVAKPKKEKMSPDLSEILKKVNLSELSHKKGKELVKLCHRHLNKIDSAINKFEKEIEDLVKSKKQKSKGQK